MIGPYKRSKFLAEQVAVDAAKSGVDVVIVNPTTPVGEQDIKPTPTGRIVVDFLKKKFPAYVDTGLNLVDATECARGHVAALENGKRGERYILGGENLTLKQILDRLASITGLPSPTVKVPHFVALGAAVVDELWTGRICGKEPRATVDAVRMGRKKMFVTSAKAEREIAWKILSVEAALRRATDWFRANGYLITLCHPETVQSVGYAGALTPALKVGELIRPARITDAGDGSSLEISQGHGILVTASCTATSEQKRRFAEMYRADAVDMEAAAVAKGAEARGIRFSALKVISDSVDFDMPPTDRFVTSEGQFRSGRFVLFAALRPWVWGTVATLAKNSKAATRVLCRALEKELIERSSEVVPST